MKLGERELTGHLLGRSHERWPPSAASATHMSEGCTAMQASLQPRIAFMRLKPSIARRSRSPGSRLLQAVVVS